MQVKVDVFSLELRGVLHAWRMVFDNELRGSGHTLTTALALIYSDEAAEPMTQKELAQSLYIEEPALVRLLDKLEQDGLVERHVASRDRRAKYVVLTEQAQPLVAELKMKLQVMRLKLLGNIQPEKLAVALEVLQMISSNLALMQVA